MGNHTSTLPANRREKSSQIRIRMKTAMMSLCFLLLSLTISTTISASIEDKRNLLGYSADQLISCVAEIEKAFEDCSHLNSTDEIMVCINDILAATNCQACSATCFHSSARCSSPKTSF